MTHRRCVIGLGILGWLSANARCSTWSVPGRLKVPAGAALYPVVTW